MGWTDWNLVLDVTGGPNHLKNLCDANIIVDEDDLLQTGSPIILQASYYYMGHFSRYLPPGSKRVALRNSVEREDRPLEPGDVKNGQALLFAPCDGSQIQTWQYDEHLRALLVAGTDEARNSDGFGRGGECVDVEANSWVQGKLHSWACNHSLPTQQWQVRKVAGGGSQIFNPPTGKCLTAVTAAGSAVGLDQGVHVVAAQLQKCAADGDATQTFTLANDDAQGFPSAFPVRLLEQAGGDEEEGSGGELCLQPQIVRVPHFDAVAFQTPDGHNTLIAINVGDVPVEFNLVDKQARAGVRRLTIPAHAIHTYRWRPSSASAGAWREGEPGSGGVSVSLLAWLAGGAGCVLVLLAAAVKIRADQQQQLAKDQHHTDVMYEAFSPRRAGASENRIEAADTSASESEPEMETANLPSLVGERLGAGLGSLLNMGMGR